MAAPQSSLGGGDSLPPSGLRGEIWGRRGFGAPGETEPVAKQKGKWEVASKDPQRSQVGLVSAWELTGCLKAARHCSLAERGWAGVCPGVSVV